MFAIIEKHYHKTTIKNKTHHLSFIKNESLKHLIDNTFHYADMTGGNTFLSSKILSMRLHESAECVRDLKSMFSLNEFVGEVRNKCPCSGWGSASSVSIKMMSECCRTLYFPIILTLDIFCEYIYTSAYFQVVSRCLRCHTSFCL
jgi:hypothetical protein